MGITVRAGNFIDSHTHQFVCIVFLALTGATGCQTLALLPPSESVRPPSILLDPIISESADENESESTFETLIREDAIVSVDPSADAAVLSASDSPPTPSMTLEDLEAIAIQSHPELLEASARVQVARGQAVQACLPFNPTLQYQSDEIGNEGAAGLHSIRLSQQYVTANKLGIARQVQAHEVQRRLAEYRATRLRVLTRVRASFAQALIAQQRVTLTAQIVDVTDQSKRTIESLYQAGEVSRLVVLQSQVEWEQARVRAENAKTSLESSHRALFAAAGFAPEPSMQLAGDARGGLTAMPWEPLLTKIASESPEMSAAGSQLQRAKWALQLACAQVTPNVTGQIGVGIDAGTDDAFAAVGVSVPLPIRNRNQGNIVSARASISEAEAAIERTRLDLQSRLAETANRYTTAWQRLQKLENKLIPLVEESYELSQTAFQAGEVSFVQLLTAQRSLIATRLSLLDTVAQAQLARAQIDGLLVNLE